MAVNYHDYMERKTQFMKKHDFDYKCETSTMDSNGVYYKTYVFTDGSIWYERMSPEYETVEAVVHGCKMQTQVKLFRTEFWSTESSSEYYYEPF